MNKLVITGRLVKDPELNHTQSGKAATRITVAVQRNFKNQHGEYEADFINAVAFDKRAEFISNYLSKGQLVGVVGRIQTGSYENKEGQRVYTTDVFIEEIESLQKIEKKEETYEVEEGEATNPFAEFGQSIKVEDNNLPFM